MQLLVLNLHLELQSQMQTILIQPDSNIFSLHLLQCIVNLYLQEQILPTP